MPQEVQLVPDQLSACSYKTHTKTSVARSKPCSTERTVSRSGIPSSSNKSRIEPQNWIKRINQPEKHMSKVLIKNEPKERKRCIMPENKLPDSIETFCASEHQSKNAIRIGPQNSNRRINSPEKHVMSKVLIKNEPKERKICISPENKLPDSIETFCASEHQSKNAIRIGPQNSNRRINSPEKHVMSKVLIKNEPKERKRCISPENKLPDSIETFCASEHQSKNAIRIGPQNSNRRINSPEKHVMSKLVDPPPNERRRRISHQTDFETSPQTCGACRTAIQPNPLDKENQKHSKLHVNDGSKGQKRCTSSETISLDSIQTFYASELLSKHAIRIEPQNWIRRINSPEKHVMSKLVDPPPKERRRRISHQTNACGDCDQIPSTSGQQSKNRSRLGRKGIFCTKIRQSDTLYNRKHTDYESDSTDLDQPLSNEEKMLLISHIEAHQRSQRRIDLHRIHDVSNETFVVDPNPFEPEKTFTSFENTDSGHEIWPSDKTKKSTKILPSIKSQSPTGLYHDSDSLSTVSTGSYESLSTISSGSFMVLLKKTTQKPEQPLKKDVQSRKILAAVKSSLKFSDSIKNHAYSPKLPFTLSRKQKRVHKLNRSKSEPLMKSNGHYINKNDNDNAEWTEGDFSEEDSD